MQEGIVGFVIEPKKGHVVPFCEFRQINRGKKRGMLEVTITDGRKVKVCPAAIRRYPAQDVGKIKPP